MILLLELILYGLLLASVVAAKEAPHGMKVFNKNCPAPVLCKKVSEDMELCKSKKKNCDSFLSNYWKLLPEYDCQRPFDHTPKVDYIVPAVWLCGNDEELLRFLSKMKSPGALKLFGSDELRNSLDGDLAEEYLDMSLAASKKKPKR